MQEALLIIGVLGGLEAVLWYFSSAEMKKQTLLLERIADNLTIVEIEEEDEDAEVNEPTAVC